MQTYIKNIFHNAKKPEIKHDADNCTNTEKKQTYNSAAQNTNATTKGNKKRNTYTDIYTIFAPKGKENFRTEEHAPKSDKFHT